MKKGDDMKAVVFHGIGDIRLEDVPEPEIQDPHDAIVRITTSAICGTDLHLVRGTLPGMIPGTIMGHEGVGIVEEVGKEVRNVFEGERVIIPSTVACGYCSYCRAGYFAQCDYANPMGKRAGTVFFGGPKTNGALNGLQAEMARVPYANVGLVKIPEDVSDDEAILLSDIFPTGYFGAELAEIKSGDTVGVYGCGPVGLFAILSAFMMGAARVLAVDRLPLRLDMARNLGAEVIDFSSEDPVEEILDLTGGIGVDRCIDAAGVDAEPETGRMPGEEPSQAITWAVQSLAKAGSLSVIGVYPQSVNFFPWGAAMNMNLTIKAGNCNHRSYIPTLLELVAGGAIDPEQVLSCIEPITNALDAYKAFDERRPGWMKVELVPSAEESLVF